MDSMFTALIEILKTPLRHDRGVKTDSSILCIYPPNREPGLPRVPSRHFRARNLMPRASHTGSWT